MAFKSCSSCQKSQVFLAIIQSASHQVVITPFRAGGLSSPICHDGSIWMSSLKHFYDVSFIFHL